MPSSTFSFTHHPRDGGRYVYAVLSRRAGGISVGVNLNPDKSCNFDCVYCQVDRHERSRGRVDPEALDRELDQLLGEVSAGTVSRRAREAGVPASLARVVELAIAGDGEPTLAPGFAELARVIARAVGRVTPRLPVVLFTNATTFHRESVREGLEALTGIGGRVLAKLDAGTQRTFDAIDRGNVPFARVMDNLRTYAARRPLWIQSMFVELDGRAPAPTEIDAYAAQLLQLWEAGQRLRGVEVGTVARRPAESTVRALSLAQLEAIASRVRSTVPDVPVQIVPAVAPSAPAV